MMFARLRDLICWACASISVLSLFLSGEAWADFPGAKILIAIDAEEPMLDNYGRIADLINKVSESAPGVPIQIEALESQALESVAKRASADLLLTSPFRYRQIGMSSWRSIAVVMHDRVFDPNRSDGGLLLTNADNSTAGQLSSLKSTRIALPKDAGLTPAMALQADWVQERLPVGDLEIVRTSLDVPALMDALRAGTYAAMLLPVCALEKAADSKVLHTAALRVISPKSSNGLACAHTTTLYPGAVLASAPTLSPEISRRLVGALLSSSPDPAGFYWSEPTDFSAVDEALTALDLDAYAKLRKWSINQIWRDYKPWFLAGMLAVIMLLTHSFIVGMLVNRRTAALSASLAREHAFEAQAEQASKRIRMMERIGLLGQVGSLFAHEIRQPLSAVSVYAYGIRRMIQNDAIDKEAILNVLSKIEKQTENAEAIVQKIRNYLKRNETEKRTVSLADIARKAAATFASSGKRKAAVRIEELSQQKTVAFVDPIEIELVLLNLMRNAEEVQATSNIREPRIRITVGISSTESDFCEIAVEDNGPAMDQEAFAQFQGLVSAMDTSKPDGLGLGLSIVKALIEAQCGNVVFERSDRGSLRVVLRLPRLKTEQGKSRGTKPGEKHDLQS